MVGRAARQRVASASRPSGRAGSIPAPSATAGVAQWQSRCLPSRRREFDSRCPLHHRHVRLAAEDAGPSNRVARVRIPHVAPIVLSLRLAGRAPGFELGGLGSNPRGAATSTWTYNIGNRWVRSIPRPRNSSVGRAEVSYASSAAEPAPAKAGVRSLLPRPNLAGLAKWEGNGLWTRHEAVRSRQPVRACSSSVERRLPNPRQRGFNSFLARHQQSGRIMVPVPFAAWHGIAWVAMDRLYKKRSSTASTFAMPTERTTMSASEGSASALAWGSAIGGC